MLKGACPIEFEFNAGKCYKFIRIKKNRDAAQAACQAIGAGLAEIKTRVEFNWIVSICIYLLLKIMM